MSFYRSVGVTDTALIGKAGEGSDPTGIEGNPLTKLFDSIVGLADKTGLELEAALTSPEVQAAIRETGLKVEEVRQEAERRARARKDRNKLIMYGGAAAIVAYFVFRKR